MQRFCLELPAAPAAVSDHVSSFQEAVNVKSLDVHVGDFHPGRLFVCGSKKLLPCRHFRRTLMLIRLLLLPMKRCVAASVGVSDKDG